MTLVTWPWKTKSRLKVGYSAEVRLFEILDPKNQTKQKKNHLFSFIGTRDKKGHFQGYKTLVYNVMLKGYSDVVCFIEILDPSLQNQNYRSSFSKSTHIPKCHVFKILTFQECQYDVIWRQMTSSIITSTILDFVWYISRKSHQRIKYLLVSSYV